MVFKPGPKKMFNAGDIIVVLGKKAEVRRMSEIVS